MKRISLNVPNTMYHALNDLVLRFINDVRVMLPP